VSERTGTQAAGAKIFIMLFDTMLQGISCCTPPWALSRPENQKVNTTRSKFLGFALKGLGRSLFGVQLRLDEFQVVVPEDSFETECDGRRHLEASLNCPEARASSSRQSVEITLGCSADCRCCPIT